MSIWLRLTALLLVPFSAWELGLAYSRGKIHGLLSGWPWPAFGRTEYPKTFWIYVVAHGVWIALLIQFYFFAAYHLD